MSYSIDTDILLYASEQESPHHERVKKFLEARGEDPDLLCLSWVTLMGYQRIATHPSIFRNPLSAQQAWENVTNLLALPRCRVITEQQGFQQEYERVSQAIGVKGNLVPDAHLAAILQQHGVSKIYTADTDFRKFEFLTVVNPIDG
jgi:toxin-antitoxin system PIN domain toxin